MSLWHWVRHGPTHARSFVGWRDLPADLSDHAAIARLRAALPDEAVLVSSDLSRARHTAEALRSPGHLRLPPDPHLREFHFGRWEGLDFEAVSARDPDLSRQYWEAPGAAMAPGGESWDLAGGRVRAAVGRIAARHPGREIVAVAHFGVILTELQRALGVPAADVLAHRIDTLSVTSIDWSGPRARVLRINHLP